jgi:prepilin signal peptidase PulO-like enzyme (type II secretory pathway)
VTVAVVAIIGLIVGFVLDELIARLACEPYTRTGGGGDGVEHHSGPAMELQSETGALAMPRLLTTASWYRRAIVVGTTTACFALIGKQYAGTDWRIAVVGFYVSVLIICAATDVLAYRVPNAVTYPAILGALALGCIVPDANWRAVVAGGLLFGGLLLIPSMITGGAMGMGDVKLAFFVGFALGLEFVVQAMLLMALAGGLAAAVLLITRVRGKGDPIPYAPFIAGGALFTMFVQGTAFFSL